MGTQPTAAPLIFFGPFEFDRTNGELRKHGQRIRLTGQPIRILEVLLDNGNRIVSREDLQQKLWAGTTFVDFEHGLNAAINKLRQALSDSADQPRFVETVPGRGYRFVAAITYSPGRPVLEMAQLRDSIENLPDELPAPSSSPASWNWRLVGLVSLATLAIIAIMELVAFLRAPKSVSSNGSRFASPVRFRMPIPQGMTLGESQTFALSPDGRTLIYTASKDGRPRLWAQSLDELEPRAISDPGLGSDAPPTWSPESKYLAVDGYGKILKLDLSGNPPETLGRVSSNVIGGAWNSDGTLIFGTGASGIFRMDAKGGEPVPVTVRSNTDRVHVLPVFLPDGRHFLYSRQSTIPDNAGVFIGSLDLKPSEQSATRLIGTPIAARFVPSEEGGGTILFQRETTLWAQKFDTSRLLLVGEPQVVAEHVGSGRAFGFFAASTTTLVYRTALPLSKQMIWFDRAGKRQAAIGEPADIWERPRLSPDGKLLAITKFTSDNTDVWIYDLSRDVMRRATLDPSIDAYAVWSPDGKQLVFQSGRSGHHDLYQRAAQGNSQETLLYSSNENKYATSWSHDGHFLLYTGPGPSIWALPLKGAAKAPLRLTHTASHEADAAFSPDDHWIAFVSNESGSPEVYVEPFSPSSSGSEDKILVSRAGGLEPHWRADGKEILYRSPGGSLTSVAVTSLSPVRLGLPQTLFNLSGESWDMTADATRFLVEAPVDQQVTPFTIELNWQARLK
jgi:Tol biopolymer transport system component/DNA-binding winged helix-turn-helix (wHTH) protein